MSHLAHPLPDSLSKPVPSEATDAGLPEPPTAESRSLPDSNTRLFLYLGAGVLLVAFVWLYWPIFQWLIHNWDTDEYYAHGPFVPVISAYLIWQKKARLAEVWRQRPSSGLVPSGLIPLALLMQWLGTLVDMNIVRALQAFSIPILLCGVARYFGGKNFERELRFPTFFFCLAVPLSGSMVEILTVPLQNYAACGSSMLLGLMGMPIQRVGVNLYTPLYHFVVAIPCSGLKTTITLFTLGVVVSHLMPRLTQFQRVALCIISIPIALFANILRIMAIVWLGYHYGTKVAEGFLHNWSGLFMFVIAMAALIGVGTYLEKNFNSPSTTSPGVEAA